MNTPQILQQLNGRSLTQILPQLNQIKQMIRSSGNPQALVQQMLQRNPNYAEAMRLIDQANGDVGKAITDYATSKGVDPQEIFTMLK